MLRTMDDMPCDFVNCVNCGIRCCLCTRNNDEDGDKDYYLGYEEDDDCDDRV